MKPDGAARPGPVASPADLNQIGALVVALHDRLRDATEQAARNPASFPAAVTVLHIWPGGASIDVLAQSLRVSHSRAVRIVDRLEHDGLAERHGDPADGRAVRVTLTAAGRRLARRVLAARERALAEVLDRLDPETAERFGDLARTVLAELTSSRADARTTCRLCDAHACGHYTGDCPVTNAADAASG